MNKYDFLHKMPFLRLLMPFAFGIVYARYLPDGGIGMGAVVLLVCVVFVLAVLSLRPNGGCFDKFFAVGYFALFFALGNLLCRDTQGKLWQVRNGDGDVIVGHVCSRVEQKAKSVKCDVQVTGGVVCKDMGEMPVKLQLFFAKDSASCALSDGDVIVFPDNLFRPSVSNPSAFDYNSYLRVKGYSGSVYLPSSSWKRIGVKEDRSLFALSRKVQSMLVRKMSDYGIKGDEFALLSAMVLGDKEFMTQELRDSYSNTGSAHVLAVSGLHVGAVSFILLFVLSFVLRGNRLEPLRYVFLILALWAYAFVTGLSPSVVRTSFMVSLFALARIMRRQSSVYNTLFVSAFVMLCVNPLSLFDVGFQLSYLSVLSIVYFQPVIFSCFQPKNILCEKAWSLVTVSIAAQFGTLPLSLYYFHAFSFSFVFSGIVVVLLSSLAIYLSVLFFLLPDIPVVSGVVAKAISFVALCMNKCVGELETVPHLLFSSLSFSWLSLVFAYGFVLFWGIYLAQKRLFYLRVALTLLGFCFVVSSVQRYRASSNDFFVVYSVRGVSALNAFGHSVNGLYCSSDSLQVAKCASNFWCENYAVPPSYVDFSLGKQVGKTRILHLRERQFKVVDNMRKLDVDVLVVGGDVNYSLAEILSMFRFKHLVFDGSNSWRYLNRMRRMCETANVSFHDVSRNGAFVLKCSGE